MKRAAYILIVVWTILAGLGGGGCATSKSNSKPEQPEVVERHPSPEKPVRNQARREELLRTFALTEAPVMWRTVQDMRSAIAVGEASVKSIENDLREFGRTPETDEDCIRIRGQIADMRASLATLMKKLQDAYIAARKYEATPGRKDYEELRRRALEDGIQEAEAAARRYRDMSEQK